MKRPLFRVGIMFALGEVTGKNSPDAVFAGAVLSAFVLGALIYCRVKHCDRRRFWACFILLFFVCFAGVICGMSMGKRAEALLQEAGGAEIETEAVLDRYAIKENSVELTVRWKGEKVTVSVYEEELLREIRYIKPGQRLKIRGILKRHENSTNPGCFDAADYYAGQGIYLKIEATELEIISDSYNSFKYALLLTRERFAGVYDEILPEKEASVVKAMFLGDRTDIDKTVKKLYQSGGIAHILAISALHVTLIGRGFSDILRKLGVRHKTSCIIAVLFILLYGMMTGFAYATVRAVIMLCAGFFAVFFGRSTDSLNSMGLALIIMLIINPASFCDAGLQMSFAAVTGVVLGNYVSRKTAPSGKLSHRRAFVRNNLLFSVFVNLVMSPVILYYYYELALYGLLINLIVIPLMSITAASAFIGGLVGLICIPAAKLIVTPCLIILKLYEWLCRVTLALPYARINIGRPPVWLIAVYYLMLTGFVLIVTCKIRKRPGGKCESKYGEADIKNKKKWKRLAGALVYITLCTVFISFFLYEQNQCFRVVFLDVGQGDGAIIHTPDGTNIMVDCGTSFGEGPGEYIVQPALKYYGMSEVDYAFLSHADTDHLSGLMYILENRELTGIEIRHLVISEISRNADEYDEIRLAAERAGTEIIYATSGEVWQEASGDGAVLEILYPDTDCMEISEDGNERSMVFAVSCMDLSVLFTGDIGFDAEKYMLEQNLLRQYDILKVPHHGSKYSSSEEFLETVNPDIAVISCGEGNSYGHPAPETLLRLRTSGADIIRTDLTGAVIVEIKKNKTE